MSVAVTIAGVDRTGYLVYDPGARPVSATMMTDQIGSASIQMRCLDGALDTVDRGQPVSIFNNGIRRFWGDIESIRKVPLPSPIVDPGYTLDITVTGALSRFDRLRIPARVYENMTAGAIVTDLITTVGSGQTIGNGTIEAGPTITRVVYDQTPLLDAIRDLATQANFVYYVDDGFGNFHFHERTAVAAPADLTDDKIRWASPHFVKSRADFRTRQKIRVNPAAMRVRRELIGPGDGVETEFDVSKGIGQLLAVAETTATRGSVVGTFTGQPADGDTVSIRSFVYTFKDTLDNREAFQVHIGADFEETAHNLICAINDNLENKGTAYSWPTWAQYNAIASEQSGGVFTLYAQIPGDEGNGFVEVSDSAANFSWSDTEANGGSGTNGEPLTFGLGGDTDSPWRYETGSPTLTGAGALTAGVYLLVTYYPLGADTITIEDSVLVAARAAIEDSNGIYENLVDHTELTDPVAALALGQGLLAAYSYPREMGVGTDEDGYRPGQLITIDSDQEFGDDLNGDWLITQADIWLDVVMSNLAGTPSENFLRTQLRGIDATRASGSYLQFWEKLATVGGGEGSAASSGGSGSQESDSSSVALDDQSVTY